MSGVKISGLPTATVALSTDVVPVVQGGVTYQESLSQITSLVQANSSNHTSVLAATTGALTVTYNNQTTGVGATLTNAGAQAALVLDGVTLAVGNRVLIKDQVSTFQNGIYVVTNIGSGATNWIMTRASDYDNSPSSEIAQGTFFVVISGTAWAETIWIETGAGPFTVGTTPIVFTQSSGTVTGGGTAALKNASDNTKATVASVSGATLANEVAVFADTAGTVKDAMTGVTLGQAIVVSGNVSAGKSGTAGQVASFPATGSKGSLILQGVANTGNTNTTISNVAMGQASVVSIPDPGGATANFAIAPASLVANNLIQASTTGGLVADSGFPANGQFLVATATLTSGQFLGMYATPVLMVAAPGANQVIIVQSIVVNQKVVSVNYAAGGVVGFQYGNTAHLAGVLATNTEQASDFQGGANIVFCFSGVSGNSVGALPSASVINTGIYISNQTGAFTTGNGAFSITIYYRSIMVL